MLQWIEPCHQEHDCNGSLNWHPNIVYLFPKLVQGLTITTQPFPNFLSHQQIGKKPLFHRIFALRSLGRGVPSMWLSEWVTALVLSHNLMTTERQLFTQQTSHAYFVINTSYSHSAVALKVLVCWGTPKEKLVIQQDVFKEHWSSLKWLTGKLGFWLCINACILWYQFVYNMGLNH